MKHYVLDANALMRYLTDEAGSEVVERIIREARDKTALLSIAVVNWGEVYYNIAKRDGSGLARSIMDRVGMLPIEVHPVDKALTVAAVKLKLSFGLAYADCFAAALAGDKATVVTADLKDFKRVPKLKILALPEPKSKQ